MSKMDWLLIFVGVTQAGFGFVCGRFYENGKNIGRCEEREWHA